MQGHELDPAGKGLARLPEQLHGGGPENEKSPGTPAPAPAFVDEASEVGKQLGRPVDLIQDHQAILVPSQKNAGMTELFPVFARLQIQVEGSMRSRHFERQRRLAHLSGTEQRDGRLARKRGLHVHQCSSSDHSDAPQRLIFQAPQESIPGSGQRSLRSREVTPTSPEVLSLMPAPDHNLVKYKYIFDLQGYGGSRYSGR